MGLMGLMGPIAPILPITPINHKSFDLAILRVRSNWVKSDA